MTNEPSALRFDLSDPSTMLHRVFTFEYLNHRGEIAWRLLVPYRLEFLEKPGYDYEPGWFLTGYDVEKQAVRSFALDNIIHTDKFGQRADCFAEKGDFKSGDGPNLHHEKFSE